MYAIRWIYMGDGEGLWGEHACLWPRLQFRVQYMMVVNLILSLPRSSSLNMSCGRDPKFCSFSHPPPWPHSYFFLLFLSRFLPFYHMSRLERARKPKQSIPIYLPTSSCIYIYTNSSAPSFRSRANKFVSGSVRIDIFRTLVSNALYCTNKHTHPVQTPIL